jgi:hypothetical protein
MSQAIFLSNFGAPDPVLLYRILYVCFGRIESLFTAIPSACFTPPVLLQPTRKTIDSLAIQRTAPSSDSTGRFNPHSYHSYIAA